jgi:chitinase
MLLEWEPVPRPHDKVIIGYYASWQWYDRDGLAAPINMDFSKITRANFAFFQITEDGEIYGTDSWADPITLFGPYDWMAEDGFQYCSWDEPGAPPKCGYHLYEEGLVYLAHKAGAEVYPSIGGWTLSDPFPPMAANPTARKHFAANCVELIKNYNFDGIDLDWEYPGYADHSGTPDDTVNFNLLLDDVRAALDELGEETGRFYGLTAALPCGPTLIGNQDVAHVSSVLTELNLMTYDLHGAWNAETGVNAPLYDQKGSPDLSVHGCVKNWEAGGAPPEKINIGFPFYGRSFIGATGLYEPHQGADDATWHQDEGVPQYYNIHNLLSTMITERDEQTMTQIAYFHTGNMVSYDDQRAICDKTEYAMDNGLKGYIIWELSGDMLDDGSTPLLDAANAKLVNPGINCADMGNGAITSYTAGAAGEDAAEMPKFYPHFDSSICLSDGLQPSWLQASEIYDSAEDCCRESFKWNTDCVAQSTPITGVVFYPASGSYSCKSDGLQPAYMGEGDLFDNEEDCCAYHFSWVRVEDCIANGKVTTTTSTTTTTTTTSATTTTTTKATENQVVLAEADAQEVPSNQSNLFFPVFESGITKCQNEGTPPSWLSPNDFKSTLSECCRSYAANYDDCMAASYETDQKYYPDFQTMSCVRKEEGTPDIWMSGDYFRWSQRRCCRTFFASAQSSPCNDVL